MEVIRYVLNQQEHHRVKTFEEEYIELLKALEIEFKADYLFEFYRRMGNEHAVPPGLETQSSTSTR
jgi:hypothetical protein